MTGSRDPSFGIILIALGQVSGFRHWTCGAQRAILAGVRIGGTFEDDEFVPSSPAPRGRGRGWLAPAVMLVCLVGTVVIAYQLTDAAGGSRTVAGPSASRAPRSPAASGASRPGQHQVPPSGVATPEPAPAVRVTQLTPVTAAAFGPGGTADGDNPRSAPRALSGNPATPWRSDWYTTARFGNLQAGTGLLLDLGRTVTATGVTIRLGDTSGATLQVRAGITPATLRVVARETDTGRAVRLGLATHPQVRYMLIWFTRLPPDQAGTYQAQVSGVTVTVTG